MDAKCDKGDMKCEKGDKCCKSKEACKMDKGKTCSKDKEVEVTVTETVKNLQAIILIKSPSNLFTRAF